MKKITTLALTGALALGALGIGSMSDLPVPGMQAEQASANGYLNDVYFAGSNIYATTLNALGTQSWIVHKADGSANVWDDAASNPRFIIKNSVGTVVKVGSMSAVTGGSPNPEDGNMEYGTVTNISLAGLPKNTNHYRIYFTWTAKDGTVDYVENYDLTKAFTYMPDGSITNIRP
jgi:hypothetical protein